MRSLLRTVREKLGQNDDWDETVLYIDSLLKSPSTVPIENQTRSGSAISDRELTILQLVAAGLPNKRIAQKLGIAPETVKTHVKNIFSKLSVTTRMEAAHRASSLGLI